LRPSSGIAAGAAERSSPARSRPVQVGDRLPDAEAGLVSGVVSQPADVEMGRRWNGERVAGLGQVVVAHPIAQQK